MGSIVGVAVAAVAGLVLAGVGSFTVVHLANASTPSSQITTNIVTYGNP